MDEKLDLLSQKVERIADLLESTRRQNDLLADENRNLKSELSILSRELEEFRLSQADRSGRARTKLLSVLGRLDQLEKLDS